MRRDAMKCAMALGLPSLGEPITLVQETTTDVQAGTLPYLPIYRPKAPLFSVADPQQALVGWAYSPLRIGDLIRAALDAPLVRFPGDAEIQVFDGKATTASLLFDSRDPEQRDSALIPGCERRLDICGRPWIQRVGLPTSSHGLWNDLSRCGSWQGEFWNRHRNGQLYRQFLSIISVRNDQGDITNFFGVQVRHQAQHDDLTGLPNRSLLVERLEQSLRQAERQGRQFPLLFLDLNRFKPINDQYRHLAGDEILQVLGQRLRDGMRASDTVARFGGDEFVVLAPEVESQQGVLSMAAKLRQIVDQPIPWNEYILEIRASIGVALDPDHGTTQDGLLAAADTAMYAAKQHGEGAIAVFSPQLSSLQ